MDIKNDSNNSKKDNNSNNTGSGRWTSRMIVTTVRKIITVITEITQDLGDGHQE